METGRKMGIGVGIMIIRGGRVLLGKRHPDPEKADSELHGEGTWTLPGGKIDFGESLEHAACREVLEETGLQIDENVLRLVSIANDIRTTAHFITIGFLCNVSDGEPGAMEPDEITEWKWFG
jgi:8-oxo-dGTP diphosphatase